MVCKDELLPDNFKLLLGRDLSAVDNPVRRSAGFQPAVSQRFQPANAPNALEMQN